MYAIDSRGLKTSIGILLYSSSNEDKTVQDHIAYYYPLVLDIIVKSLNSSHKNSEEAVSNVLRKEYGDDANLDFFYATIYEEVRAIKKQFVLAGFDQRLKYKLVTRRLNNSSIILHSICMDLDATLDIMSTSSDLENVDVSNDVIEHPSIDQLETFFDKR